MRRFTSLAIAALVASSAVPLAVQSAAPASAAGSTTVYVVNAFTYDASSPAGSVSVCVDGVLAVENLAAGAKAKLGGFATGNHTVDVYNGDVSDCSTPGDESTASFPSSTFSTLMIYKAFDDNTFHAVALDDEDSTCVAAGLGRLVLRNAAETDTGSLDIYGTPSGGSPQLLVSDVSVGAQGAADLPVGTYSDVTVTEHGNTSSVFTADNITIAADTVGWLYLWGGADGSSGSFSITGGLDACSVVTTTTTAPTTTIASTSTSVAPATAAQPVAATPTFTG